MRPRLFDRYVMVDWSAAATRGPARPTADRCWIGVSHAHGAAPRAHYCRTRREAEAMLLDLLSGAGGNALVGFDFPFGYPAGCGLGGGRALAARLAALIEDDEGGRNNRFEVAAALNAALNPGGAGPFWGCPGRVASAALPARGSLRSGRRFADHRAADSRLRHRGIQSCWKLYTTGSVGSQVLMGLPVVHRLVTHPTLAERTRIWPFETGWDARLDGVVVAEIWPSLFPLDPKRHAVKDACQVMGVCAAARAADVAGRLRAWFAAPDDLPARARRACLREEGWILGLPAALGAR